MPQELVHAIPGAHLRPLPIPPQQHSWTWTQHLSTDPNVGTSGGVVSRQRIDTTGTWEIQPPLPWSDPSRQTALQLSREGEGNSGPHTPRGIQAISTQFAHLILETINGRRRITMLKGHFACRSYGVLANRCRSQQVSQVGLGSIRVQTPNPHVAEIAMRLTSRAHDQAAAFRLILHKNRWICTDLELG
ncbi:MAG: Rv3235 family protein [Propionibacteriaceae bacterium]|nr:Rv3235 family protein [Propionibacteriaceae bacterium]